MNDQENAEVATISKTVLDFFCEGDPEFLAAVADIELEIPPRRPYQRNPVEFD